MSRRKLAAAAALVLVIGGCASTGPRPSLVADASTTNAQSDTTRGAKDSLTALSGPE